MSWPGFPQFMDGTAPGLDMDLGKSCTTCAGIPCDRLPFETEDAYPHHLSLDALEKSLESCATCALIYWAAGCSLVDYGGYTAWGNMQLASGAKVSTRRLESVQDGLFGLQGLPNGATIFASRFSSPVADYRPPLQVDLRTAFPSGTVTKDGEVKSIRPWLFGNWYKSAAIGTDNLLMVGLGVRLGTSEKLEDAVDFDGKRIQLRGSYIRFRTDQEIGFIPGRIRAADAGSSYAFEKLRNWLKICNDFDDCMSRTARSNLPTRVLDVSAAQDTIFLRETRGQKGKYLALSHSWGSTHRLTLTRANLEVLKGGIQCADIPKTFQDAVKIARELKIAYLWIDSLCIIQDDIEDWEVEASYMGDVYAGSYLTIASLSSKDDSSGCFPELPTRFEEPFASLDVRSTGRRCFNFAAPMILWGDGQEDPTLISRNVWATDEVTSKGAHRSWLFMTPEWMPCSTKEDPRLYLIGEFGASHDPIADEPLSQRAWTLQERILAPRTIHYGRTEMYWECQNCVLAEDGALLRRTFTTPKDLWGNAPDTGWRDRYWHWAQLVEQYSTRRLTRESDKLPALSGLAHLIAKKTGDIYLAGLWKSNLLRELTWSVRTYEPNHMCSDPEHDHGLPPATKSSVKYPTEYRAPSWSWASLDAEIQRGALGSTLTTCVDVQVETIGKDAFGRVLSGKLTLKGPVYTLSFRELEGRHRVIHPLQTGVYASWSGDKSSLNEKEVVKQGMANFDSEPIFPSMAILLDGGTALILKEGPRGEYTRIGTAKLTGKDEADEVDIPNGAVREITIV